MNRAVRAAVEAALGARVESSHALSGGDINDAFRLDLSDGRVVFAKTNAGADATMFPAEARGLGWLAEAGSLRVPEVLAVAPGFLVLEHLGSGRPRSGFDEELGRGLAALHRASPPGFGLDHDNFIGSLPQRNAPEGDWATFYRTRRLEPQLAMAIDRGRADRELRAAFERLFAELPTLVGPAEPPARLHGDLWGGNLHVDEVGAPCLIDPAVYGGHREMDLAMMRLFGGFAPAVFRAYQEAYPLADGHAERVALYQLYPLMVHVNLFGGGYVGSVKGALARYVG